MGLKIIEEGKTSYIELTYVDRSRYPLTPVSLRYRVDDLDSGAELLGWTAATPSAATVITIGGSYNHLHVGSKSVETRVVTTEATFSGGEIIPKEIRYQISNLRFYTPS
jgi:hypothetical protein